MRNHSVPDEDLIFAVSQAASADKKREKKRNKGDSVNFLESIVTEESKVTKVKYKNSNSENDLVKSLK